MTDYQLTLLSLSSAGSCQGSEQLARYPRLI